MGMGLLGALAAFGTGFQQGQVQRQQRQQQTAAQAAQAWIRAHSTPAHLEAAARFLAGDSLDEQLFGDGQYIPELVKAFRDTIRPRYYAIRHQQLVPTQRRVPSRQDVLPTTPPRTPREPDAGMPHLLPAVGVERW